MIFFAGVEPGRSLMESWTSKISEFARVRTSLKRCCAIRASRSVIANPASTVRTIAAAAVTPALCRRMNLGAC